MSFTQELNSWFSPTPVKTDEPPQPGNKAPSAGELQFPLPDGKAAIVAFLRHCGCPFSEKTLRRLKEAAAKHTDIAFIAVSHSNKQHTERWLQELNGAGNVRVIVDDSRAIYARYGLGTSSFTHVLNPSGLVSLFKTGTQEGIWNRPTESGSRWQTSGTYVVNGSGNVIWGGPATGADDVPDFEQLVAKL